MILFWGVAGLLAAVAAALVLSRAARAALAGPADDPASAVYERQLAEIDELADRGLIADTERKGAHAEAARRLLSAAEVESEPWLIGANDRKWVLAAAVAAPAAALAIYMAVGFPGLPDQPFRERVAHWRATDPRQLTAEQMAAVLEDVLRARPNDVEGLRYLALAEGAADSPAEAIRALRRAITLAPNRADLWEMLGQALAYQNEGVVGPNAQVAFRRALELDPSLASARQALATDTQTAPPLDAIRGMVASLAAKLKDQPDDPEGWVRLVRSYAVLGDTAQRDAALKEARARFAGQPKVQAELTTAAATRAMAQ
jgi:cytochrome c-type biogenesis protein CcmH